MKLTDQALRERMNILSTARSTMAARRDEAIRRSAEAAAEEMALRQLVGTLDTIIEETSAEMDRRAKEADQS
jgi:hypothetical protein